MNTKLLSKFLRAVLQIHQKKGQIKNPNSKAVEVFVHKILVCKKTAI